MRRSRPTRFLFTCLVLSALLLLTACGKHKSGGSIQFGDSASSDDSNLERVTVKELCDDFANIRKGLDARDWRGKIEVKGQILHNIAEVHIAAEGNVADDTTEYVVCSFADPEDTHIDELAPGQSVTIQGERSFHPFAFSMSKCKLVEAGPSPLIHVGALEMAQEYATDPVAADKKYLNKQLLVEGTVQAIVNVPREKEYRITLDGVKTNKVLPAQVSAWCVYNSDRHNKLNTIVAGQKIRIRGTPGPGFAPPF
jgi:hypothetical protein